MIEVINMDAGDLYALGFRFSVFFEADPLIYSFGMVFQKISGLSL